jgi:hypothetical protein
MCSPAFNRIRRPTATSGLTAHGVVAARPERQRTDCALDGNDGPGAACRAVEVRLPIAGDR